MGEVKSDWVDVSSGIPQGSFLGSLLFASYINDSPDRINNKIKLFACGSKILAVICDWKDAIRLQDYFCSIWQCSEDWMMQLNVVKCKIMHFGLTNPKFGYFMMHSANKISELEKTNREKDLVLYSISDLDWKEHSRTNKILGSFRKAFVSRDSGLWKKAIYLISKTPS